MGLLSFQFRVLIQNVYTYIVISKLYFPCFRFGKYNNSCSISSININLAYVRWIEYSYVHIYIYIYNYTCHTYSTDWPVWQTREKQTHTYTTQTHARAHTRTHRGHLSGMSQDYMFVFW